MKVSVIGTGYVGLVAGACFAENGHTVICVDNNSEKIESLKKGIIPIYEPGLSDLVVENQKAKRLSFTTSLKDGVEASEVIFIAVGTPQDEDGSADLTHVLAVAKGIGQNLNSYKVIVDKSTVPVGTADKVKEVIKSVTSQEFDVVSNPEFLKEGAAIDDFLHPDRVVIGVPNSRTEEIMRTLYAPFIGDSNPLFVMDIVSAELTKYAANAMLATRISFMNEISRLCEVVGADIDQVRRGIGSDSRIGMSFLRSGIGYGGSCFPKDVQALIRTGKDHNVDLSISVAVEKTNYKQKLTLITKIKNHYKNDLKDKVFAVWGLAFKPKTDDVREAPALTILEELLNAGAIVQAHDPEANFTFSRSFGEKEGIKYYDSHIETLNNADALILCTEWGAFANPDYAFIKKNLKDNVVFDGRNLFDLNEMIKHKISYYSVGRKEILG